MMNLSETFFTSKGFEFLLKYEGMSVGLCGSMCYKVPLFRIGVDFLKSKVRKNVVRQTSSHKYTEELWDFTCTKLYLLDVADYDVNRKSAFIFSNKDQFLIFVAVIAILNSVVVIVSASVPAKDFKLRMINR